MAFPSLKFVFLAAIGISVSVAASGQFVAGETSNRSLGGRYWNPAGALASRDGDHMAASNGQRYGPCKVPTLLKGQVAGAPTPLPYVAVHLEAGLVITTDTEEAARTFPTFGRCNSEVDAIQHVAMQSGGRVRHPIGDLPGWWLLEYLDAHEARTAAEHLATVDGVEEAVQQVRRKRAVRTTDPYFSSQWHLKNTGQGGRTPGLDLNVEPAWQLGFNGSGVRVAVVDDGVDFGNPDLGPAHYSAGSYDFEQNTTNPLPKTSFDDHGTACAGLVGARANNNAGVAAPGYGATLSGLRVLAANQSDATEASALGHMLSSLHVYTNSWGPSDNGNFEAPGALTRAAIQNGVATGRGGRGAIYVWAGGNGGSNDNANYDGYANMPETISVSAVTGNGVNASYSEFGDCHLVAGMAGSSDIVTTDRVGSAGYNYGQAGNLPNQDYTNDFEGTSASTPMVAGVVAQMLQARPTLTWRDVQHILVRSSERFNPTHSSWQTNGAGYKVSHRWGFGLADAAAATSLAANWQNVGTRTNYTSPVIAVNAAIPESPTPMTRAVSVTQQLYCEHVQVKLTLDHSYWGDLVVDLVSPLGTVSNLAMVHAGHKAVGQTSNQWTFMTVQSWGEPSAGTWTLRVRDGAAGDAGFLENWQLIIHGTQGQPGPNGGTGIPLVEDVNGDAVVDVIDVQFVVNLILGLYSPVYPGQGDVDGNSSVDVVDVQRVVNKILNP